jgi:hypothetical protein
MTSPPVDARKPRLAAAINAILLPVMHARGFRVVIHPDAPVAPRWSSGAVFVQGPPDMRGPHSVVNIGAMKFGGRLALNLARTFDGRTFEPFDWTRHALPPEDLSYGTHDELERAVHRVVDLLERAAFAWLCAQGNEGNT